MTATVSPVGRRDRWLSSGLRWFATATVVLVVAFLLVPAILVVVLSFSNEPFLHFPPAEWGTRQYEAFLSSKTWTKAVATSFAVAGPAALVVVLVGLPATFALNRTRMPLKQTLEIVGLVPLIIPGVVYAIAVYVMYLQFHLVGNRLALILAYVTLALPFVILIVGAAIKRIPRELELVAMTLGASRRRAMIGITLRLLMPAVIAAFVFAFIGAFDEATFINFLGGPGIITLAKAIFDSIRLGVDPLITAIAAILMLVTGIGMTVAGILRRS